MCRTDSQFTAGSYGNEQINVVLGEGWQGLTVKAVFQPSGVPVVVPDGGGVISVPWEATQSVVAYPRGRISFQGYVSGRLVNTSDVCYTVGGSSAGTHNTPAPTPDDFQQFIDAVKDDAESARQAATEASEQAQAAAGSASASAESASGAEIARQEAAQSASDAAGYAEDAAKSAELAQQDLENKGWMYLDDEDNSGTLHLVTSDSLTDDVTLRDNGAGVLEVVYG